MDDTSFDLLCKGLSPAEAKLFRKIIKEWCSGDEDSFPVQLALLTRAQWLAAAQIPLILQKSIAALEAKLAEHQKQSAAFVKNLATAGDDKIKAFEKTVAVHTEAMEEVADKGRSYMDETEKFARGIRKQMELGLQQSERISKAFFDEKRQLEQARHDYERNMEWRETFQQILALMLTAIVGFIFGWYIFSNR